MPQDDIEEDKQSQEDTDMTPQEREMLTTLIDRLRATPPQPKDSEAKAMIQRALAVKPDIPYLLTQTVLIQELALNEAQQRLADAERRAQEAAQSREAGQGGFLGGLLGGRRGSVPSVNPWGRERAQSWGAQSSYRGASGPMIGQSSGFLRTAAATAAGVVGGALLFEGIQSLFGSDVISGVAQQASLSEATQAALPAEEPSQETGYQEADYQQPEDQPADDTADQGWDFGSGDDELI